MTTIKIYYPMIVLGCKEVQVSEEKAEDLIDHRIDQEKFIYDSLDDSEQEHTSMKMIYDYNDFGIMKMIERC